MRLALFSALAENPDRRGERLAFQRFAGRSVLAHQIDCAAQFGCERVIVLASGLGQELLTAQRHCERSGMRFQQIDGIARLSGQVTAEDVVLIIADGMLPDRQAVMETLDQRPGVLAFPADAAVPMGFERIDADYAWSGVLRARGERVSRLMDLPPDIDVASALLRVSLQSGGRIIELDPELIAEGHWLREIDPQDRPWLEQRWLSHHVAPAPFVAPGLAIAERIGMRLSQDISGSRWEQTPLVAGLALAGIAGMAGVFGYAAIGLGIMLAAMIGFAIAGVFDRVARLGAPQRTASLLLPGLRLASDGLILYLLTLTMPPELGWLRLFVAGMPLGLLRLGEKLGAARWRSIYSDRILLLFLLLPFALTAQSVLASAVLAAIALLSLFPFGAPAD